MTKWSIFLPFTFKHISGHVSRLRMLISQMIKEKTLKFDQLTSFESTPLEIYKLISTHKQAIGHDLILT